MSAPRALKLTLIIALKKTIPKQRQVADVSGGRAATADAAVLAEGELGEALGSLCARLSAVVVVVATLREARRSAWRVNKSRTTQGFHFATQM